MLNAHITTGQTTKPFWVDLLNPTAGEIAQVAADFAIQVPSRESPACRRGPSVRMELPPEAVNALRGRCATA
jgi:Mg2+ and Co2+ transporter CorA